MIPPRLIAGTDFLIGKVGKKLIMSASMTLDKRALDELVERFHDPLLKREIESIPQRKAVAALVAQAIADNFALEGPGWAPLKPETIRRSVSKAMQAKLSKMSDEELVLHEKKARKSGKPPHRAILRRSGLLFNTVTTPGYTGSIGGKSGKNIWKTEGHNLVWGTDLVYAGVHNYGYPAKNIPQREFLVIRKEWMKKLNDYIIEQINQIIKDRLLKGST